MRERVRTVMRRAWEIGGGIDVLVLLSVLMVVGGIWLFVEIADRVVGGESARFDEAVLLAFRDADDLSDAVGGPEFEEVVRDVTALGSVTIIGLVTFAAVGALLMDRKMHAAALVLVAIVGGQLLSSTLKAAFDRPRPDVVPHMMHAAPGSFPSGHSLMAAVTYLTLGALLARMVSKPRLKVFVIMIAVAITGLVGVSRVYLGVHYPTDVLGGWTVGLVWSIVCWEVAKWLQGRGMVEQAEDSCAPPASE